MPSVNEADFATPARSEESPLYSVDPDPSSVNQVTPGETPKCLLEPSRSAGTSSPARQEAKTTDESANKQVRFDQDPAEASPAEDFHDSHLNGEDDEEDDGASPQDSSSPQKRGLVSRRGRGARPAVAEYKTYRSPSRKREDEVPSLCSATSNGESTATAPDCEPASSMSCEDRNTDSPLEDTVDAAKAMSMLSPKADKGDSKIISTTPTRRDFQTLPSLDDAKLMSPGGAIFLSPSTPSRRYLPQIEGSNSFDEKKSRSIDRDTIATPTDFSLDYGKNHGGSFDTSNVLAWLQSPTANGLFSPGGYASILNTPGGPRTPRTPTVSTSFFFSDVASLPRGGETTPSEKGDKRKNGISSIICISPLSSSKARTGNTPQVDLKDVFSSPQEKSKIRCLPLLRDDAPTDKDRPRIAQRNSSKDPSLDAVHLAERDLMEDEDMSVLMQLASNTPRPGNGGPVFRSPSGGKKDENLPALQLPMIGGQVDPFAPPQLEMRPGSGSKESSSKKKQKTSAKETPAKTEAENKPGKTPARPGSTPYSIPPYPHRDMPYYPVGMPPGMPGSMRVVVGGPPPPKGNPARPGVGPSPTHSMPYHDYPYPPPGMYPQYGPMGYPYQGYSPQPPRPPPPYGAPAPVASAPVKKASKSPAPASAPAPAPASAVKPKSGTKKASPLLESKGATKKPKKATPNGTGTSNGTTATNGNNTSSSKKRKIASPPIEGAERQKAAASVHAVNVASGGKNDKAAALAAAILRGVTMRPSGKWQAQLYFAGKSRYIGVFDTREKAALAYEIAREKLKAGPQDATGKSTENMVNAARKAAFEGVNERVK